MCCRAMDTIIAISIQRRAHAQRIHFSISLCRMTHPISSTRRIQTAQQGFLCEQSSMTLIESELVSARLEADGEAGRISDC